MDRQQAAVASIRRLAVEPCAHPVDDGQGRSQVGGNSRSSEEVKHLEVEHLEVERYMEAH